MLRVIYSNRTEVLAAALAQRVAERTDVLEPITIVVPNRAMERWLEMEISAELGIAANLRFTRLVRFLTEAIEDQVPILGERGLEGRILEILLHRDPLTFGEALGPAVRYVHAAEGDRGARERRAAQLAQRMTELFNEYALTRPDMLAQWRESLAVEGTERWQSALFRAALGEQRLLGEVLSRAAMPASAHVFGISYWAPAFSAALSRLGERGDITIYALNPCREFWEDARSAREQRRSGGIASWPSAGEDAPESTLLSALGRPGREHLASLDEHSGFAAEARFVEMEPPRPAAPDQAGAGSLAPEVCTLQRIQSAILNRVPVPPGALDRSVRVLACPSIRREAESVAAEIWSLIDESTARGAPIRFHEIAVLLCAAERDNYLPHLEAAFHEARELPWSAIDLALAARSRVASAALRLIELLGSRFERDDVLEIVAHPLVLARWSGATGEPVSPARAVELADRLGAFFGIDELDHRGTYLEGTHAVHWDQAVRRLALGAVLEPEAAADAFPEPNQGDDAVARGLGLLVRSLAADARFAREAHLDCSEWARFFGAMLSSYLTPSTESEERELQLCIRALGAIAERGTDQLRPGLSAALELARRELEQLPGTRGEPFGDGVVIATLLPMRAIPFRAVFVLGLGEGQYPARSPETGLDLRALHRRKGDVSIEERDRYTFLETLLSARDRITFSYVARDEQTGEVRQPSPLLTLLDEALGAPAPRDAPPLRRHDELAPDRLARDPTAALAIESAWLEARARELGAGLRASLLGARAPEHALASLGALDPRRALLELPAIPAASEPGAPRFTLETLQRFLACPIQGHARAMLGGLAEEADASSHDEPLEAERPEQRRVLVEAFLEASRGGSIAEAYRRVVRERAAHGRWPIGPLAQAREATDLALLERWRESRARIRAGSELHRYRLGGAFDRREHGRDRPLDPLVVQLGGRTIDLVGRTQWALPDDDFFMLSTYDLEGDGERVKVERLRLALEAFVDHAVLAARPPGGQLASGRKLGPRRVWVLDGGEARPWTFQLAPMRSSAAERWLAGLLEDLIDGPHGLFLPCEAVLRADALFSRGGREPEVELARSIEIVRNKAPWLGGSSRYGPVRDAIDRPAPAPARALAIASRRFGAFFDHLRAMRRSA